MGDKLDRSKLSQLLEDLALYMNLLGENPFKVRAHENAARIIEKTSEDLDQRITEGTLGEIKGIGPALKEKILEFSNTGIIKEHLDLKAKIPLGLLKLIEVPGLGPKKAKTLYDELGIKSVGELEYACRENRLIGIKGFGEKTQISILKNVEFIKRQQHLFLFSDAYLEGVLVTSYLKNIPGVFSADLVGGLRRRSETVKGIGVVLVFDFDKNLSQDHLSKLTAAILRYPGKAQDGDRAQVSAKSDLDISFFLENGMPCKIKIANRTNAAFMKLSLTGSPEHLRELEAHARENGFSFSQVVSCPSEESIYEALGLQFIEPELRENLGEIKLARAQLLPVLIEQKNLKGIFHCHTKASDGSNSLEEMVMAAQKLGFEYIGISDHSASAAGYANGLRKDRVLDQFKEIEALQKKVTIKIFKGIESDILSDGSLDYEDEILKKFDFVIGSIHSGFSQAKEVMTARVLKAVSSPYLDFLGHPTGRLLLARDAFQIDMHQVIEAAARVGLAVEMNANPQRLDLDWRLGAFLRKNKGVVSINPDAHSIAGLEDVEYGIGVARKAGFSLEDVINTRPAEKVLSLLRRARGQRI